MLVALVRRHVTRVRGALVLHQAHRQRRVMAKTTIVMGISMKIVPVQPVRLVLAVPTLESVLKGRKPVSMVSGRPLAPTRRLQPPRFVMGRTTTVMALSTKILPNLVKMVVAMVLRSVYSVGG